MPLNALWAITRRELHGLFLAPLAWAVLSAVALIVGLLFLAQLDAYVELQPSLRNLQGAPGITHMVIAPLYGLTGTVMLFVVPLLTMRSFAEERRNGSLTLLTSAPVPLTSIVLGKFFGLLLFMLVILTVIGLMPASLLLIGTLDFGRLAAAVLGLFLLLTTFSAIGLYLSSLTDQPTLAAVGTFGALLALRVLDWAGRAQGAEANLITHLSLQRHQDKLLLGVFDSADLAYHVILITLFLALTIRRLDAERTHG